MNYLVINTTYSKTGEIRSTSSVLVTQCEFNKFRNLFDDAIHIVEVEVFQTITILNIKLFHD